MTDDGELARLRDRLVDELGRTGRLSSPLVSAAFRAVPRHVFLPDLPPTDVYRDEAFPTRWSDDGRPVSSSSQPAIMAVMLEQLGLERGHRVLEIGAGTGYNAALLAHIVGEQGAVTAIDIDAELVAASAAHLRAAGFADVRVAHGDGAFGCASRAPFDRIIVTAGAWDLAPAWLAQIGEDGRLVVPLSLRRVQRSVAFERAEGHLRSVSIYDCGFMHLRGAGAGPQITMPLGGEPGLYVELDEKRGVDVSALLASLAEPGDDLATGVEVSISDVCGGLGLWLALHEPDIALLHAMGPAVDRGLVPALISYPGYAGTTAILDNDGLAVLVALNERARGSETFEVAARPLGASGLALAGRLSEQVNAWDRAARPATDDLQIRAYPSGVPGQRGAVTIVKRHARLELDWLPNVPSPPP